MKFNKKKWKKKIMGYKKKIKMHYNIQNVYTKAKNEKIKKKRTKCIQILNRIYSP